MPGEWIYRVWGGVEVFGLGCKGRREGKERGDGISLPYSKAAEYQQCDHGIIHTSDDEDHNREHAK